MERDYLNERTMGYFQVAAGGVDTVKLLSELITTENTASSRSLTLEGVSQILIMPEAQSIRSRDDGIAPTAAIGYPTFVQGELEYTGKHPENLRIIGQAAGAIVNIWLLGQGN